MNGNSITIIMSLILTCFFIDASIERSPIATTGKPFFFELRNRTSKPLYIRLYDGDNNELLYELNRFSGERKDFLLLGRSTFSYFNERAIPVVRLSGTKPTKLMLVVSHEVRSKEQEHYDIDLTTHDTAFVSYEDGTIRPQQGRKGVTISGLSLQANVTWQDIKRLRIGTKSNRIAQ